MIVADWDMILLNQRLNQESRVDVFYATRISGVSFHHKRRSAKGDGYPESDEAYQIRIPVGAEVQDGKTYLPEGRFSRLADEAVPEHWTLRTGDFIIICAYRFDGADAPALESETVTEQGARELAENYGLYAELIQITDYSDNTRRGSVALRHWRIGGV